MDTGSEPDQLEREGAEDRCQDMEPGPQQECEDRDAQQRRSQEAGADPREDHGVII